MRTTRTKSYSLLDQPRTGLVSGTSSRVIVVLLFLVQTSTAYIILAPSTTNAVLNFHSTRATTRSTCQFMSSEINNQEQDENQPSNETTQTPSKAKSSSFNVQFDLAKLVRNEWKKMPPFIIQDTTLLFYDVILLLNLAVSVSFHVVHRFDLSYILSALSEGSLLSILWILSGLLNGAFLNRSEEDPKAAGMLGLQTIMNASSLRILMALVVAFLQHRPVGVVPGEDLISVEIAFGLILMSIWRLLHSNFAPRM